MSVLSVQLYSVREQLAQDRPATLARLAEIGYRYVEPFGLGDLNATSPQRLDRAHRLRADLDTAGLRVSAVHAALPSVTELAEECAIVGTDLALIPHPRQIPGFAEETFRDIDAVDAFADALGEAVEHAEGLRLGYHNHWFEWSVLRGGTTGYDRLWARTHHDLLAELDVYWAVAAGADPASILDLLGQRVVSVHLKDGPGQRGLPQQRFGFGAVDIPGVLGLVDGVPWHVTEIDSTEDDPFALLEYNARVLADHGTVTDAS